jgi:hypothetical protein
VVEPAAQAPAAPLDKELKLTKRRAPALAIVGEQDYAGMRVVADHVGATGQYASRAET